MNIKRIFKHFSTTHWSVKRAFPPAALQAIESAIQASEATHRGEVRFVVEGALDSLPLFKEQSVQQRAIDVFAQLRIWDTEENNGLLIYLLLADRAVEIVADRGIHAKVGSTQWEKVCHAMESAFRKNQFADGALQGIEMVTQHLQQHFPARGVARNELSNLPALL